jgi:ABC-2 type transport system permease protein
VSDTAPGFGFLVALAATALACCLAWLLFRSGTRLKS